VILKDVHTLDNISLNRRHIYSQVVKAIKSKFAQPKGFYDIIKMKHKLGKSTVCHLIQVTNFLNFYPKFLKSNLVYTELIANLRRLRQWFQSDGSNDSTDYLSENFWKQDEFLKANTILFFYILFVVYFILI
jgi:hypothetical protein